MNKYNWSALCRQRVAGWKSPTFRVQFNVFGIDEECAHLAGALSMALARQNVAYQKVNVVLLEEGVINENKDSISDHKEVAQTEFRTMERLRRG